MTAPLEYPQLVALSEREPAVLVRTVTGRWVPCVLVDLGVEGGFRMWRAVPVEQDLTRAEVAGIWSDVPPWSAAIALLHFPGEHDHDCTGDPVERDCPWPAEAPVSDGRSAVAPADRPDDPAL